MFNIEPVEQRLSPSGLSNTGFVTTVGECEYHDWEEVEALRRQDKVFPIMKKAGHDMPLPEAIPRVDLAVIHVVLLAGVEHKLSFMGAIFLQKTGRGSEKQRQCFL